VYGQFYTVLLVLRVLVVPMSILAGLLAVVRDRLKT